MKPLLLALMLALAPVLIMAPSMASADEATDAKNKAWNVDKKLLEKLAKEKKCKDVVMYREVLPFFGKETTKQASREITVQFEKEDLKQGRAVILHEKSNCEELIGSFLVMCTTDTALCYFHEKEDAGKGKKLDLKKGKRASGKKNKGKTVKSAKKKS